MHRRKFLGTVAIGAGSCMLVGSGARWIETTGAVCLIGFGALAVTAPLG